MQNSSHQMMKTKSMDLTAKSSRPEFNTKPIENTDFINYDYGNLFRTSYTDMSSKVRSYIFKSSSQNLLILTIYQNTKVLYPE